MLKQGLKRGGDSLGLDTIFKLSVIVNMIDNLTGPMARASGSTENAISRLDKANQGFGNIAKTGAIMTGVGASMTSAMLSPVEATFETRKALGELASLGVKDLEALEKKSLEFSSTWAGTTKADFISAAYDIKSGISTLTDSAVAEYTNIAGVTAKATKASVGEMTSLFATGYGIYKDFYKNMSDIEFGEMFSAGIAKSVQAFKTEGSQMAQAISNLGGSATTANVPLEEQLSILGMLQATMSGGEAGTKYKAFLRSAAKAGDELGLSFTDANNNLLSMPEILAQLPGKFGETMDAAEKMKLQKAFGSDEAVALIDLLYNKTGDLQGNITMLYGEMGKGIAVATDMATAMNSAEGEKYKVIKQRIQGVKESIGNELLPTINTVLDKVANVVENIGDWVNKNKDLVRVLATIVMTLGFVIGSVGAFATIIGGAGFGITKTIGGVRSFVKVIRGIPGAFETLQIKALYAADGIKVFGRHVATGVGAAKEFVIGIMGMAKHAIITGVQALPGLIASVWSFTAALFANPVTWIVIGIIALIAVIILLAQNWDAVTAWISGVWNGFVEGFKATCAQVGEFFGGLWKGITDAFVNGIQGIKDFFLGIPAWFKESGAKIMTTFAEGIKGAVSAPVNAVKSGLSKIREMLPFSDAHEGPLSQLTLSGSKVFSTITAGMELTKNMPAEMTSKAFKGVVDAQEGSDYIYKADYKYKAKAVKKGHSEELDRTEDNRKGDTIIQKLEIKLDLEKLKDLPQLFKLIDEIKEYANGYGGTV